MVDKRFYVVILYVCTVVCCVVYMLCIMYKFGNVHNMVYCNIQCRCEGKFGEIDLAAHTIL